MEYSYSGYTFEFNEPVEILFTFEKDNIGRLVQVRKKVGQFGSDVYFVRMRDGSLSSFENVGIKHYLGKSIPIILDEDNNPLDSENQEYRRQGKYPEVGFVIENPKEEQTPGFFGITITN